MDKNGYLIIFSYMLGYYIQYFFKLPWWGCFGFAIGYLIGELTLQKYYILKGD